MKAAYIMIGEIVKPQGVRGEVKLRPITSDVSRFEGLENAFFKRGESYVPVKFTVNRISPEGVFLTVEGVNDRNAAEKLRGKFLYVDRAHSLELTEDETLICDLVGLKGVDDEGAEVGLYIEPDAIHIMKKSEYSGMYGDYSSFSNELDELSDAESEPDE